MLPQDLAKVRLQPLDPERSVAASEASTVSTVKLSAAKKDARVLHQTSTPAHQQRVADTGAAFGWSGGGLLSRVMAAAKIERVERKQRPHSADVGALGPRQSSESKKRNNRGPASLGGSKKHKTSNKPKLGLAARRVKALSDEQRGRIEAATSAPAVLGSHHAELLQSTVPTGAPTGAPLAQPLQTTAFAHPAAPVRLRELYHEGRLYEALGVLCARAQQRAQEVVQLERAKTERVLSEHELSRLKGARSATDAQRWLEKLLLFSEPHPTLKGYRVREVAYAQALTSQGVCYGRRYAQRERPGASVFTPAKDGVHDPLSKKWSEVTVALTGAPRATRRVVAGLCYQDLDMVNSFMKIALGLAQLYGVYDQMDVLRRYADDAFRDEILRRVMEHHAIYSRDDAKRLPITLLHLGPYICWLLTVEPPQREKLDEMVQFAHEISVLVRALLGIDARLPVQEWVAATRIYRDGGAIERAVLADRDAIVRGTKFRMARSDRKKAYGLSDADRTAFSRIVQTYEDWLLRLILEEVARHPQWEVGSLQYDGLYLRHLGPQPKGALGELARACEAHVKDCTEGVFEVTLKEKELLGESVAGIYRLWSGA